MKLRLFINLVFSLFFISNAYAQVHYIRLGDASGFDTDQYEIHLEQIAEELVQTFPTEFQDDFKVYDYGFYLHNEAFVENQSTLFEKVIASVAAQSPYYLLFGKQTDHTGVYTKFWVDVKLPATNDSYPCLSENLSQSLSNIILVETESKYTANGRAPHAYSIAEIHGMKQMKKIINSTFNCCGETENDVCDVGIYTNETVANWLTNSSLSADSRFLELKEISNIDFVDQSYDTTYIDSNKNISFDVDLEGIGGVSSYSFTDKLVSLSSTLQSGGIPVDIVVSYFDPDSLNKLNELYGSSIGGSGSGSGGSGNLPPSINDNMLYEPSSYTETIIVLDLDPGAPPRIFSKIDVTYVATGESWNKGQPNNPTQIGNQEEAPIPLVVAAVGREILKRAMMASVNVAINVIVEVAMEKYIVHGGECSWVWSWQTCNITGTHLVIWAAEGALTGGLTSIGGQALAGATSATLIDVLTNENSNLETALTTFGNGLLLGVAVGFVGKIVLRAYNKFTLKYLALKYNIPDGAAMINKNEFKLLFVSFFENPKLIQAWEGLFKTGLRTNVSWLERAAKWIDDGLQLVENGAKVSIKKNGSEVGEIIDDLLHVKYPYYGGNVVAHNTKTTTVVGKLIDEPNSGGISTILNSKLSKSGNNPGGVNALNETIPSDWPDEKVWNEVNKPWLESAAGRGDVIRAVSDPNNPINIYDEDGVLTFFGRENELLTKPISQGGLGYSYDPSIFSYVK